jgi:hypothetical protein
LELISADVFCCRINRMPEGVLLLKAVVLLGGLIAAAFWLAAAQVTVPDDQGQLHCRSSEDWELNSIGAAGASAAAIAALVLWTTSE